jgi:hypothetical protein
MVAGKSVPWHYASPNCDSFFFTQEGINRQAAGSLLLQRPDLMPAARVAH